MAAAASIRFLRPHFLLLSRQAHLGRPFRGDVTRPDDDWERVESTELEELFSAATAERRKKLQLYGVYKIATEGPCTAPQPSAIKMKAWKKLYLDIVSELGLMERDMRMTCKIVRHWAVDRGHLNLAEMLVSRNADVNAKDNEGLTALHYAAVCDREGIAEYLVKNNADTNVKDNDGNSPSDLCESNWSWLQHAKD